MIRLEMKKYQKTLTEKQQKNQRYHLEKNDKYEYLTGEEILPLIKDKSQDKLSLHIPHQGKLLKKKTKTIEEQGKNK